MTVFGRHPDDIYTLARSSDGKRIVTVSEDGTAARGGCGI
jgi:hypothetical protein